jgi:membrane protease YdiL (CAAX protease family)
MIIKYFSYTLIVVIVGAILTTLFAFVLGGENFVYYSDYIKLFVIASGLIFVILLTKSAKLFKNIFIDQIKFNDIVIVTVSIVIWLALDYVLVDHNTSNKKLTYILFFRTVLIIPFLEEVLFRGVFQRNLTKKYNWKLAILISSFFFVMTHYGGIYEIIKFFGFSIIAGLIYYKTNSLMTCIIFHSLTNLGVALLYYI